MNKKKRDTFISIYRALPLITMLLWVGSNAATILFPSDSVKSFARAMLKVKNGDTIIVKDGVYKEQILLPMGISLVSQTLHKAVIDGSGLERVVIMGHSSMISGFDIKNGQIGIYSEGRDNIITKCFIHDNIQSGISCVGHLPKIEDNIIVENRGSGIQGWDVRSTIATINHNTIAFNNNHGISIGGNSEIVVENSIISFNQKLGLKVDLSVKMKLLYNNFYYNGDILMDLPMDNFSYDPLFIAPKEMNFALAKESKCRNMGSDTKDLGSRFTF
ncbi:MAG: right-handed parallel beta-helix repeat-containing protein [Chitinivibrionales bacterium]|nr:right-handed parallel beta-helix repeat-containing protein [Chitinivibrionales bacterium]